MAGKPVTAQDIATAVGSITSDLAVLDHRVQALKDYLDAKAVTDLTADPLNINVDDANLYKSVVADLGQLLAIFRGEASLAAAKDFRVFCRRVWGLGATDRFR
jgi:hypothetical protein